jgi:hypothetical protein
VAYLAVHAVVTLVRVRRESRYGTT